MLKQLIPHSVMSIFFGVSCCLSSPVLSNHMNSYDYPDSSSSQQFYDEDSTLAQNDPYKLRSWNWDYKESWREDKDVFYSGGTQTRATQRDFRYEKPPGVGDPDDAYWLDPQFYRRPSYDYQRGYHLNYNYYPPSPTYYNQSPYYNNQSPYNYNPY